jgi:hypothetical protein
MTSAPKGPTLMPIRMIEKTQFKGPELAVRMSSCEQQIPARQRGSRRGRERQWRAAAVLQNDRLSFAGLKRLNGSPRGHET